jgi:hypothetical protein
MISNQMMKLGRSVMLILCSLAMSHIVWAQPMPSLSGMAPIYLRQGETREVVLNGQNLGGAQRAEVAAPKGLTAELLAGTPLRVKLSAAGDAPLGERELRIVTPLGVTRPVGVTVGQFQLVADKEPNNATDSAQPLPLPAAIVGRIDAPGDVDVYRLDAKKGQHLIFDAHAVRVGSPLEPVMTVHDASGRELPRAADEYHGGDPLIAFDVPADGAYLLQVRDLQYRGGADFGYRIEAGEIPYVEALLPMSGRRGEKVAVKAIGHNLGAAEPIVLDLGGHEEEIGVRAKTPAGWSNALPFSITDESRAATAASSATQPAAVPVPSEISGVLREPGAEHFYKFRVPATQPVTLAITARKTGSPLDALLTLKTAGGEVIEQSNGGGDAEARISRQLNAGEFIASVRDLTYAGGQSYSYRLSLTTSGGAPDFAVRVMPDSVRIARGGNAKLWCEVTRAGGLRGPVTLTIEGLPAGVTPSGGPVTIEESTSGTLALTARTDAPLGTIPINIRAIAPAAGLLRGAELELNGRIVAQAYLTVIEALPFTVDAIAALRPEQLRDYPKQVADIRARLSDADGKLATAQAAWEQQLDKQLSGQQGWKALEAQKLVSASGTKLSSLADGIISTGGGADPERDNYTITATTDVKGIIAIRLEALSDPALPSGGPGRAQNGNIVVNRFAVTAAPKSDPSKVQPVKFKGAAASFEQGGFPVTSAIGAAAGGGWALAPETGKSQVAVFTAESPIGFEGEEGTVLTITLDQQFGAQHTLGRFRLSVTADAKLAVPAITPQVPAGVVAAVHTPAEQRTAEQKARVAEYYRMIAPELSADRARLESLRQGVGPYAEIARLEEMLGAPSPQLDAERVAWEKTALSGGWIAADVAAMKSEHGSVLNREADGSILASGDNPDADTYTITATTASLKRVTGVRLEVLPDDRLPGGGPGRAADGNFVLSRFGLKVSGQAAATQPAAGPSDVAFASVKADFEQPGFPIAAAIDARAMSGWAISPNVARPLGAVFVPRTPIESDAGTKLIFTLEHSSKQFAHYTLGRFRLWLTDSPSPAGSMSLPPEIASILKVPQERRNDDQKAAMTAYYQAIAPSLEGARRRLAELKARVQPPLPLTAARNKTLLLPVPITRAAGFSGDVIVTLEGFSSGRDPATRQPTPIARNIIVTPLTLRGVESFGKLNLRINPNSEVGTRMVVLRCETKIGNDAYVQYSPAFLLTVTEK